MWGVQIVTTEFSDDFRQLQLILNYPDGGTVQKHHFGGLLEAKNALLGSLKSPEEARYQAKVCCNHNFNPVRRIGSSWDQIWPIWTAQ